MLSCFRCLVLRIFLSPSGFLILVEILLNNEHILLLYNIQNLNPLVELLPQELGGHRACTPDAHTPLLCFLVSCSSGMFW